MYSHFGPPNYSLESALSEGWRLFKSRYGALLGLSCAYLGLAFTVGLVATLIDGAIEVPLTQLLMTIFVTGPLYGGFMLSAIQVARGEPFTGGGIFDGFRSYWRCVGAYVLTLVVTYGIALLCMAPVLVALLLAREFALITLAAIALPMLLMYLYLSARIFFTLPLAGDYLAREQVTGVFSALNTSWRITQGRAWSLIGLYVIVVLVMAASFVLLLLPLVFLGVPFAAAVLGAAYTQITHQERIAALGAAGQCPHCGYSLEGIQSPVCPECGESVPQ